MTNLSSVSKAHLALGLIATLVGLQLLVTMAMGEWLAFSLAVPVVAACVVAHLQLERAVAGIRKAADVCEKAAKGDLNVRVLGISGQGDIARMLRSINRVLDLTEAFCKEANAAMLHANDRRYYRKIVATGLRGEFARHAATINGALELMERRDGDALAFAENEVRRLVLDVSRTAAQLRTSADRLNGAASQAVEQAITAAAGATQASANVQGVASAAEELTASFGEIMRQVGRANEVAAEAATSAQRIDATVLGLAEAASRIGAVVGLIQEIAAKTNLLALNATIEAARAGEYGKGFAVVAGEVKSLANQTAKATEDIAAQVESMQSVARDAVEAIREIGGTVGLIEQTSTAVVGAVEQQNAVTMEISRNVAEAAAGTGSVSLSAETVRGTAERTNQEATDIGTAASGLTTQASELEGKLEAFIGRIKATRQAA